MKPNTITAAGPVHDLPTAILRALLTAEQVAERLDVTSAWVYAAARAGRIPTVNLGRYRRFRPGAIDEWVEREEQGPRGRP